jgi:tRNA threonylcarbamoyladenosine biosynthesis protein TsaB
MILLAVDTSTPQIGLALYNGAQVLAESLWTSKARHTVELAPAVAEMLAHTGLNMEEIKALGVAVGPGSFTSLRVGLSFVKGLAFAGGMAVVGINTLDVLAAGQPAVPIPLACLLPAGRGRLALGWYHAGKRGWQASGPAQITRAADLADSITQNAVVCGDLDSSERHLLKKNSHISLVSPALSVRRPGILAELSYARWQAGQVDDISTLAPVYLHIADAIPGLA